MTIRKITDVKSLKRWHLDEVRGPVDSKEEDMSEHVFEEKEVVRGVVAETWGQCYKTFFSVIYGFLY